MTGPRTHRKPFQHPAREILAALFLLTLLAACQSSGDNPQNRSLKETGQEVFAPANGKKSGSGPIDHREGSWSILIGAYSGPDQARDARNSLAVLQSLGFMDAFAQPRGKATVVAFGHYPQPGDPQAQEDLNRIREFTVDGDRPYARAMMVPPDNAGAAAAGDLDLRSARKKYGKKAVFTLQVAVYSRTDDRAPTADDLAQFHKAAEDGAAQLRQGGEEAFFFHGPNRSLVTVGVFDYDDYDRGSGKPDSTRLQDTKKRHPYNLLNGAPYRAKRAGAAPNPGKTDDYVRSELVEIPAD